MIGSLLPVYARLCVPPGGFHAYDWGSDQLNVQHHQSTSPPVYDLAAVTSPVALYWSDNDYFAEPGVGQEERKWQEGHEDDRREIK